MWTIDQEYRQMSHVLNNLEIEILVKNTTVFMSIQGAVVVVVVVVVVVTDVVVAVVRVDVVTVVVVAVVKVFVIALVVLPRIASFDTPSDNIRRLT